MKETIYILTHTQKAICEKAEQYFKQIYRWLKEKFDAEVQIFSLGNQSGEYLFETQSPKEKGMKNFIIFQDGTDKKDIKNRIKDVFKGVKGKQRFFFIDTTEKEFSRAVLYFFYVLTTMKECKTLSVLIKRAVRKTARRALFFGDSERFFEETGWMCYSLTPQDIKKIRREREKARRKNNRTNRADTTDCYGLTDSPIAQYKRFEQQAEKEILAEKERGESELGQDTHKEEPTINDNGIFISYAQDSEEKKHLNDFLSKERLQSIWEQPIDAEAKSVDIREVSFSAVSPKALEKGTYSIINIIMYEEAFRDVVEEIKQTYDEAVQETKSGIFCVEDGVKVKVALSAEGVHIGEPCIEQTWHGKNQIFAFDVMLLNDFEPKSVLFTALVYFNGVLATRLKFKATCGEINKKMVVSRQDIQKAFVSYASKDRKVVTCILQGLRTARPDLDIFFDVEKLRRGSKWKDELIKKIEESQVLYLCWSRSAKKSKWVDFEWRYGYDLNGSDFIEPIPLEPPYLCAPPEELSDRHFNDMLLYIRNA